MLFGEKIQKPLDVKFSIYHINPKEEADQVKDFRPISLVHSFAKLVTKMLANRLASRLD